MSTEIRRRVVSVALAVAVWATAGACDLFIRRSIALNLVVVVDLSASVEPGAVRGAVAAILASSSRLVRGDTLTLVPVTGDALAETPGRVLRYEVPTDPVSFDDDIRILRARLTSDLEKVVANAAANPAKNTDLLGAVAIASQEFIHTDDRTNVLIVLSDLIQDDRQYDFARHADLETVERATALAETVAGRDGVGLAGARVYVGSLRSGSLKSLPPGRRDAIRAFWEGYFRAKSAGQVGYFADGPGALATFLQAVPRTACDAPRQSALGAALRSAKPTE
jgi:hypothetical protein